MAPRVDSHQHLWTEPLLEALASRRTAPFVRRVTRGWLLRLDGEPSYRIADDDDVRARTRLLGGDRIDRAVVTPSMPLGIETLPPDEARPLVAAFEQGVRDLPESWAAWGSLVLDEAEPADVDALIDRGFVGLCLPATAIATPSGLERHQALLARLESRGAPLFVHPGPAVPDEGGAGEPEWWPAMTSYMAQMNAAWHSYVARGRVRHPRLRVLFAMLAGGAPLHIERLTARGGPQRDALGDELFYDTSSYGPRALRAMAHWVGTDQLVYGSDRPLAKPRPSRFPSKREDAMRRRNPARLFGEAWASA